VIDLVDIRETNVQSSSSFSLTFYLLLIEDRILDLLINSFVHSNVLGYSIVEPDVSKP
jgi:hypothetical protein